MSSDGKAPLVDIVMFMRNLHLLREYIRNLLENDEEVKDDLLTEPDDLDDREEEENVNNNNTNNSKQIKIII